MLSDREIKAINQRMVDQGLADAYEKIRKLEHKLNSLEMENARLKSKQKDQARTIMEHEQSELENSQRIAELTKSNQYKDGLIERILKSELTLEDVQYLLKQKLLDKSVEEMFEQEEEVVIDSTNSSFPPSSDETRSLGRKGAKKKGKRSNEYNSRKKTGRKRGGQKGHKGTTLTIEEVLKMVEDGVLEATYMTVGEKSGSKSPARRVVLDIEIKPVAKIYEVYGEIPKELTKPVTYGANVRALSVLLDLEGLVAVNRIAGIVNGLSGNVLKISVGTVYNFLRKFAEEAGPEFDEMVKDLLSKDVLGTDSTKFENRESKSYVRNHSNEETVCYIPTETKTVAELRETEILPNFGGVLVHDHEVGMYHFGEQAAECNAHNNRDLTRVIDETGHQWPKDLKDLLNSANKERKKLIAKGIDHFEPERIKEIEKSVIKIVKSGWKEYKNETRNVDQTMESNVLKRFTNKKYREAYLLFLHDFSVPFTNNMSERDLRKVVNKRKDIKKFGKFEGLERFCRALSVSETLKRRSVPQFQKFQEIIRRNAPNL